MSRSTRRHKTEQKLRLLEQQFRESLVSALRECASGKWGIFGQNDRSIASEPLALQNVLKSQEAEALLSHGEEILRLRRELDDAEEFGLYKRYLQYRQLRSSNTPGEPKLAIEFLRELGLDSD